jgi:hypothetical protein
MNEEHSTLDVLKKAYQYLDKGSYDLAKTLFNKVLEQDPKNLEAMYGLFHVEIGLPSITKDQGWTDYKISYIAEQKEILTQLMNTCSSNQEKTYYTKQFLQAIEQVKDTSLEFGETGFDALETLLSLIEDQIALSQLKEIAFSYIKALKKTFKVNDPSVFPFYLYLKKINGPKTDKAFEQATLNLLLLCKEDDFDLIQTIGEDYINTYETSQDILILTLLAQEHIRNLEELAIVLITREIAPSTLQAILKKIPSQKKLAEELLHLIYEQLTSFDLKHWVTPSSIEDYFQEFLESIDLLYNVLKDTPSIGSKDFIGILTCLQELGFFNRVQTYLDSIKTKVPKNEQLLWLELKNTLKIKNDYQIIQEQIVLTEHPLFVELILLSDNPLYDSLNSLAKDPSDSAEIKFTYLSEFSKHIEEYQLHQAQVVERNKEKAKREKEQEERRKEEERKQKKTEKEMKKTKTPSIDSEQIKKIGTFLNKTIRYPKFILFKILELSMFAFVLLFMIFSNIHFLFPLMTLLLYLRFTFKKMFQPSSPFFDWSVSPIFLVYLLLVTLLLSTGVDNLLEIIEANQTRLTSSVAIILALTIVTYLFTLAFYSERPDNKVLVLQFLIKYGFFHVLLWFYYQDNYISYVFLEQGNIKGLSFILTHLAAIGFFYFTASARNDIDADTSNPLINFVDIVSLLFVVLLIAYLMNLTSIINVFSPYMENLRMILIGTLALRIIGGFLRSILFIGSERF